MTTLSPTARREATPGDGIDPRGPRFAAGVTAVVLAAAVLLPTPAATGVVGVQALLFAVGAVAGVQRTPAAWLFRRLVRPRLEPPADLEDPRPPRFAQAVGLVFAVVSVAAYAVGATLTGQIAAGLALVAALLNAAFGLCLGCELYLVLTRLTHRKSPIQELPNRKALS